MARKTQDGGYLEFSAWGLPAAKRRLGPGVRSSAVGHGETPTELRKQKSGVPGPEGPEAAETLKTSPDGKQDVGTWGPGRRKPSTIQNGGHEGGNPKGWAREDLRLLAKANRERDPVRHHNLTKLKGRSTVNLW